MGSKFLECFPEIAKEMLKLFPEDTTFYTTDLEILTFRDEAVNIPLAKAGDRFLRNGPAATCIRTGKVSSMDLDASYYGIPIKVVCSPVFDDDEPDKIIGAFGVAISRDKAFKLRRLVNIFEKGISEINNSIAQIADNTTLINLSERKYNYLVTSLEQMQLEILDLLDKLDSSFKAIDTICSNINKEADNQGDSAREFKTWTEEFKMLSQGCQYTTLNIKKLIQKIEKRTDTIVQHSDITLIDSEEQEAAIIHVAGTIEELADALKELQVIARKI